MDTFSAVLYHRPFNRLSGSTNGSENRMSHFSKGTTEMPSPEEVVIVHLRRPRTDDPRTDPFWEFGSFGLTGCHDTNLLSIRNANGLAGKRLAFAQGGKCGTRLVLLTPPVEIRAHSHKFEVKWNQSTAGMPFRYDRAPILVQNDPKAGYRSTFPKTAERYTLGKRPPEGQFASYFRSRTTSLEQIFSEEIIRIYEHLRKKANPTEDIAIRYSDALPTAPNTPESNRGSSYKKHLREAKSGQVSCKPAKRPVCRIRQEDARRRPSNMQ
jgi:hypothetical protein